MNLAQLERVARRSTHKLFMHSALIYSGDRLLATGYNHSEIHAEHHAISRLTWIYRTGNSRLPGNLHLVSFMTKRRNNNPGTNSLPCPDCMNRIRRAGIRKVTFFNGTIPCQMTLK